MKKILNFFKEKPLKAWAMILVVVAGFCCMGYSIYNHEGFLAILSFLLAVVPAAIWFDDYKESLKVQQNLNQLNGWRSDIDTELIDNPEWIRVILDSEGKVLGGIHTDGSVDWKIGIPEPIQTELEALKKRISELEKKGNVAPGTSGTSPKEPEA